MEKPASGILVFLVLIGFVFFGCIDKSGEQGEKPGFGSGEKVPEIPGLGVNYYPQEGQGYPEEGNYSPENQQERNPQDYQPAGQAQPPLPGEEGSDVKQGAPETSWEEGQDVNQLQEEQKPRQKYNYGGGNSMRNVGCEGTGPVNFTHAPRNIGDIGMIEPLGLMSGNHVTPTDHQYYYPSEWTQELDASKFKDVYAPAAGVITDLQSMPAFFSQAKGSDIGDYRIILHHTCTFYSIYIHVNQLSPRIKEAMGGKDRLEQPLKLEAGELIGRARAFDFSVHDEEKELKGFIFPEHYRGEVWKIHTVDPFDYFVPEVRKVLLTKNLRTAEPVGGKIDNDVPGTLAGNWFVEGTNWYEGVEQPEYWGTHASFSPDARDSTHFIVSLGDYGGQALQFGARGNSPRPEEVGTGSGLVKYELVDFEYVDESGSHWNRVSYARGLKAKNSDEVKGTVLVQLLEEGKMRIESFPGKTAGQVSGFTADAKVYER